MKRMAALLLALALMVLITACGSNSKGVSEEQVHTDLVENKLSLADLDVVDSIDYSVSHNISRETHTDTATVVVTTKSKYGTYTRSLTMYYQYHKSDDLWKLLDIETVSSHFDVNPESFIGSWEIIKESYYKNEKTELYLNIYDFDGNTAEACFLEFSDHGVNSIFDGIMKIENRNSYLCFEDEVTITFGIEGVKYLEDKMTFIPF